MILLAQKPFFASDFDFYLLFLYFFKFIAGVKFFLPGIEGFYSDWCEGGELGLLEDLLFLLEKLLLLVVLPAALHQTLLDPIPDLLDDFVDDGPVAVAVDDVLHLAGDGSRVVAGESGDGLHFILEGCAWVLARELEHQLHLVLVLPAGVGVTHDDELLGAGVFERVELLQVDVL